MSVNPSWRPARSSRRSSTRKLKILALSGVVACILTAVVYLLFMRPLAPKVHFAVISADLALNEAPLTPRSVGNGRVTENEILKVAKLLKEKNPDLVDVSERPHRSLKDFTDHQGYSENASAVIYLSCDAICRLKEPGQLDGEAEVVLLMPEKNVVVEEKLGDLLDHLRARKLKRSMLLLDISGPQSGFASGSLADGLQSVLQSQLKDAAIPNLCVICSHKAGERSWEFKAAVESSEKADVQDGESPATPATGAGFPTAFGHFVVETILDGHARSNEEFLTKQQKDLGKWVGDAYGEVQTVWSPYDTTTDGLLRELDVPSRNLARIAESATKALTASEEKGKSDPSKAEDGTNKQGNQEAVAASEPAEGDETKASDARSELSGLSSFADSLLVTFDPMKVLELDRDQSDLTRFQWLALKETSARLNDRIVNQKPASVARSPEDQIDVLFRWIGAEVEAKDSPTPREVKAEPTFEAALMQAAPKQGDANPEGTRLVLSLPASSQGRTRFAADFVTHIDREAGQETEANSIELYRRLLKALPDNGWPLRDFPESMATIYEVVLGPPTTEKIKLKPLSRLLTVRRQILDYLNPASASGGDRDPVWLQISRVANNEYNQNLESILTELSIAERWLSIGAHGDSFAASQIENAERLRDELLKRQQDLSEEAELSFRMRRELPFYIQFLAGEMDRNGLKETEELEQLRKLADNTGDVGIPEDFALGQFPAEVRDAVLLLNHLAALPPETNGPALETRSNQLEKVRKIIEELKASKESHSFTRFRLLAVPHLNQKEELAKLLYSNSSTASLSDKGVQSGEGIWMGYWSLRTLDWLTGKKCEDGWKAWGNLIASLAPVSGTDDVENKGSARKTTTENARIHLAEILKKSWSGVQVDPMWNPAQNTPLTELHRRILQEEADRRSEHSMYPGLYASFSHSRTAKERSFVSVAQDKNQSVGITDQVQFNEGVSKVYIHSVQSLQLDARQPGNWYELKPEEFRGRPLRVDGELKQSESLCIVGVDSQNAPVDVAWIQVSPPLDFQWDLVVQEIISPDEPARDVRLSKSKEGPQGSKDLLLPPYTEEPRPLRLGLVQMKGAATQAKVSVYPLKGGQKLEGRPFLKDTPLAIDGSEPTWIPVVKPPATESAPTAPASVSDIDGMLIEITPMTSGGADAPTQPLRLTFEFHEPESFANVPRGLSTDENNKVSVDFNVEKRGDTYRGIRPNDDSVKAEIYTSWNAKTEPLQDGRPAEIDVSRSAEFSMDVVGVKDVFRWNVDQTSIEPSKTIGVTMSVVTPEMKENVWRVIEGECRKAAAIQDGRKPLERAEEFLFGGTDLEKLAVQWDIAIPADVVQRDEPASLSLVINTPSGTPHRIPQRNGITGRYVEDVRVAAGENVFLVSTNWRHHSIGPVVLAKALGQLDEEGMYECQMSLNSSEPKITKFWIDHSMPEIEIIINETFSETQDVRGIVRVSDSGSGVKSLRVGFSAESMKDVDLSSYPKQPNIEWKNGNDINLGSRYLTRPGPDEFAQGKAKATLKLIVEAKDFLDRVATVTSKPITFTRKLPTEPVKPPADEPGGIVVFGFGSYSADFEVTVIKSDGKKRDSKKRAGQAKEVAFESLPPGTYEVKWEKDALKGEATVRVQSGKVARVEATF